MGLVCCVVFTRLVGKNSLKSNIGYLLMEIHILLAINYNAIRNGLLDVCYEFVFGKFLDLEMFSFYLFLFEACWCGGLNTRMAFDVCVCVF